MGVSLHLARATKRQEVGLGGPADLSLDRARKERDRIRADAKAARGAIMAPVHKLDRIKTVKAIAEEWLNNGMG